MQTGPWKCDKCGQLIDSIDNVYVEWLSRVHPKVGESRAFAPILIHNISPLPKPSSCHYNDDEEYANNRAIVKSLAGDGLVGDDGLMKLLHLLDEGKLPRKDVIELIQRLHIANYEQAKPFLESAIDQGEIEPNMNPGFYWQNQLLSAINWANTRNSE